MGIAKKFALPFVSGLLALGVVWALYANFVTGPNKGNKLQNGLNAQYNDNINYLSDCIGRVQGTANIATAQTERVGAVLTEVVKGRYDNQLVAALPGNAPAFVSALVEDYPDMRPFTKLFEDAVVVLNGCRTDYRDKQTLLLERINTFDNWRNATTLGRLFGGEYPTDGLRAEKGNTVLEGQAAFEQMNRIVKVAPAKEAYETGVLEEADPFGVKQPR